MLEENFSQYPGTFKGGLMFISPKLFIHLHTKMLFFLCTKHVTWNQCYKSDSLLRPAKNHIEKLIGTATSLTENKDSCTADCTEIMLMHLSDT